MARVERLDPRHSLLMSEHRYDVLADERERLAALGVDRRGRGSPEGGASTTAAERRRHERALLQHLDCLCEAAVADADGLFADHVAWARVLLETAGRSSETLKEDLAALDGVVAEVLEPEAAAAAHRIVAAGLRVLDGPLQVPPSFLERAEGAIARRYLQRLLAGHRHEAIRLVLDAVEEGMSMQQVYLDVFVPTLHEVGRLWQVGSIDVGQEHFCSATVQVSMSMLYPRVFQTPRVGRTLVAGCVGDELHEIGVRMVADFFELAGWNSHYLGANVPDDALVARTKETGADVVALSVTLTPHLRHARRAVAALRRATDAKILVGGYPMSLAPRLWLEIGADGSAPDGPSAVREANRLVEESRGRR